MAVTLERVVTDNEIDSVVKLANTIWREHYPSIIGNDQIEYMLGTYHSAAAISDEIGFGGYRYYLIYNGDNPVGYIGAKMDGDCLFLSKIYILAGERGSGLGNHAMEFLRDLASSNELKKITLTVNKKNSSSIAAYETMGFRVTGEVCVDIGEGYVMDDYQMELEI